MPARIIATLLLLCSLSLAQDFLPVSVWYAGGKARAPMLEPVTPESRRVWREDLVKIRSLGFNTVRTWVEWASAEPRRGQYRLEQLDLMLALAQEVGLKVIIQVYVDSAPDWVGEQFAEARFVAQNGVAIPSQGAPGYCTDHRGVRQAVHNFYKEVARHAVRSPAFFAWDLWSEPHVINWAEINYIPHAEFCYCPYSLARFREWLQKKYGALDALNRAWYRNFERWEQVEPPRFDTILSYSDYIDWRTFITDRLADDLAARNAAVKEIAPHNLTTSHSAVPGVFTSLTDGAGNPDDWLMYRSVDYYGVSLYPKHSLPAWHWSLARRALAFDFARSASSNRGFYVGELQGGFGVRGDIVSMPITPADLREYMWAAAARGAKGINVYALYPMSSGYESGGYGLINLDGTLTERSKAAGETARQIADNADMLMHATPQPAEAAILFNHATTLIGGSGHSYRPTALRDSNAGYHRMFFERNLPVDFLSARFLTAEQVKPYKLIVAPYPLLMDKNVAHVLEQFVHDGGHLFLEAKAGWVDERGYAQPVIPGYGFSKMAGVREASVVPKDEFTVKWGSETIPAAVFQERFEVLDPSAKAVATFDDGTPAAYQRAHGKGSVIVFGAFAGLINETKPLVMNPLGAILAEWAGLAAPQLKWTEPVEVRQMLSPQGRMVFLFNHGDNPSPVEFSAILNKPAGKVREITTGQTLRTAGTDLRIQVQLPPRSVRVYRVDF